MTSFARAGAAGLVLALAMVPGGEARASAAASASASAAASAVTRVSFPYHDAELLGVGESDGGHVVVPSRVAVGERVPLVVFLHGVNMGLGVHMWLGGKTEPDLGALVEKLVASGASPPYVLAGPSQTKNAWSGHAMWKEFDLDDFVQAVDDALGARAHVDRRAVIVLGHSGAGCNPDGGILYVAKRRARIVPRAILAIDTCLDEESGDALGRAPAGSEVWVRWQPEIWPRPLDRFRAAFRDAAAATGRDEPTVQRVDGLGGSAHDTILLDTFATLLPQLVATTIAEEIPPGASDP